MIYSEYRDERGGRTTMTVRRGCWFEARGAAPVAATLDTAPLRKRSYLRKTPSRANKQEVAHISGDSHIHQHTAAGAWDQLLAHRRYSGGKHLQFITSKAKHVPVTLVEGQGKVGEAHQHRAKQHAEERKGESVRYEERGAKCGTLLPLPFEQ